MDKVPLETLKKRLAEAQQHSRGTGNAPEPVQDRLRETIAILEELIAYREGRA